MDETMDPSAGSAGLADSPTGSEAVRSIKSALEQLCVDPNSLYIFQPMTPEPQTPEPITSKAGVLLPFQLPQPPLVQQQQHHLSNKGTLHPLSGGISLAQVRNITTEQTAELKKIYELVAEFRQKDPQLLAKVIKMKRDLIAQKRFIIKLEEIAKQSALDLRTEDGFETKSVRWFYRIQKACKNAGCEYYVEKFENEEASLSVYGKTFIVDITIGFANESVSVSFRHLYDSQEVHDENVNHDLERMLKRDKFGLFESILKRLADLEKLDESFADKASLKAARRDMESDALAMRQADVDAWNSFSNKDRSARLQLGIGLVRKSAHGLRIQYEASACICTLLRKGKLNFVDETENDHKQHEGMDTKPNQDALISSKDAAEFGPVYEALLSMEASMDVRDIATGSQQPTVIPSQNPGFPPEFTFSSKPIASLEVQYVLELNPPIIASIQTAQRLSLVANSALVQDTKPQAAQPGSSFPNQSYGTLLYLLCPEVLGVSSDRFRSPDSVSNIVHRPNDQGDLEFFQVFEELAPAVTIHRIPLCHPREIVSILRSLRQQVVFNELYMSCMSADEGSLKETSWSDHADVNPLAKYARNMNVPDDKNRFSHRRHFKVEISTAQTPNLIQACVRDYRLGNGQLVGKDQVTSLSVHISPNGEVSAKLRIVRVEIDTMSPLGAVEVLKNVESPIDDSVLSKFISVTRNIPLLLHYVLKLL